ncbi:hypothetical protein BCU68_04315 [Vibrio sp. 10N.286.49.B3]|uniref:MAPEG family protein n=1 Tax=Vibrio sp. 10N.286.49.B3 TaxID=1880855 RepID=UPI000C82F012|nr:MAPEG family protein [Vibrio sp. 10N.286.49.B3]PMH43218.1 hypothetical protein BCU68_04315 [Vibrio sp. 10N.286.49.B3]
MITALYASLLALLMLWLSIQVIKQRRLAKVAYADGGVDALQIARSAHGNAVDYIPITLILMALLEYNSANIWLIHLVGLSFLAARIIHAIGILKGRFNFRVQGMILTFVSMAVVIILNLVYLPFERLF